MISWVDDTFMSYETPFNAEGEEWNISDGMEPVAIPERITKENFAAIFGGRLPDGLDPNIFESGELELEQ